MEKQNIELKLPANLKFSSLVRHMTEEVFSYIGFTKEWSSRLKLVVDELFMNAVKYGSTEDISTVNIELSFDENIVEFRIQDDGTGSHKISVDDLKKRIQQNADTNDVNATSGRGLALITSLWTDELKVEEASIGGIAIYFMKKIETTPPPPMQIEEPVEEPVEELIVEFKGPTVTVKLQGEIDQSNLEKMTTPVREKLDTLPEGAKLVLDFADVVYINSTVIGHLAEWHNDAEKKKGKLVLVNVNNQIKDVLDLVGLNRVLNVE